MQSFSDVYCSFGLCIVRLCWSKFISYPSDRDTDHMRGWTYAGPRHSIRSSLQYITQFCYELKNWKIKVCYKREFIRLGWRRAAPGWKHFLPEQWRRLLRVRKLTKLRRTGRKVTRLTRPRLQNTEAIDSSWGEETPPQSCQQVLQGIKMAPLHEWIQAFQLWAYSSLPWVLK